jgi:deoxyribodipyrimidine photolyase-related protein
VDCADRIWGDAEAIGHTLDHADAHHIERLMIPELSSCSLAFDHMTYIAGAFRGWHEPYANGGVVGTKPYVAGGGYINKIIK